MKTLLSISLSACSFMLCAQPIIQNGNDVPIVGYEVAVSTAPLNLASVGSAGANQTWDFSAQTFTLLDTMKVITPSSAPMASSFSNADYAYTLLGTYSFMNIDSSKMEVLAYTITAAGQDKDYTPNPRTLLKFPFNFNDTVTDTWQKVGDTPNNVTLIYDAYGTLITPYATYTDVVRIRENYGAGEDDYQWYILNPLMQVAVFDHNTNMLYYFDASEASGINNNIGGTPAHWKAFPNPASGEVNFSKLPSGASLRVMDLNGRIVHTELVSKSGALTFNTSGLANGVYQVQCIDRNEMTVIKLIVNN